MDEDGARLYPPSNDRDHAQILLTSLHRMVSSADMEVGVTLLISGQWVSGILTSYRKYVDAFTDSLEEATGEPGQTFARVWGKVMEPVVADLLDEPFVDQHAVYLRGAHIWLPNGVVIEGGLLSVTLSSVDAFQLGMLESA